MITCALSATAFDLMPNFKAILTGGSQKQQHKIKLFEVFGEVARYAPNFLLTGDRLQALLQPQIELAIKALSPNDYLSVKLCKSQAIFMRQFAKGYEERLTGEDKEGYKKSHDLVDSLTKGLTERLKGLQEAQGKFDTTEMRRLNEI
jgi:hypothetical protein